jgi:ketosteroid isomerase-like protein
MSITAFSGTHALGGERHDKEALRRWFGRLGRVLPTLHITVNNIWVKGWPWHTTVFAQWDGAATLLNGDESYVNRGLHVFTLRCGRVYVLEEFQDSQAAAHALVAQAAAGLEEAAAEQIVS